MVSKKFIESNEVASLPSESPSMKGKAIAQKTEPTAHPTLEVEPKGAKITVTIQLPTARIGDPFT